VPVARASLQQHRKKRRQRVVSIVMLCTILAALSVFAYLVTTSF
jgi:uncharacterized membrane protein